MKHADNNITIQFLGGAGTVTGSKYLIETKYTKILVDCGLFQGLKNLRLLNREPFPIDPSEISHLLLTHAHLDHTGYIPMLVKKGFHGSIFGTEPTLKLAEIILYDSARIQEEEAKEANEKKYSKHKPAKPLYTEPDVKNSLKYFHAVDINTDVHLAPGIHCKFIPNGHILGSTFIELTIHGKTIVFSGDVGQEHDYLLYPPIKPTHADVLLIESTYGDKLHPKVDPIEELDKIVQATAENNGILIIPSFAVERTQVLMYLFYQLQLKNKIHGLLLYLDSPMSNKVVKAFNTFKAWRKLPQLDWDEICKNITFISSQDESQELIKSAQPRIVIAGSGMGTGGRVLNYFEENIDNPNATILIVGFQAEGTRGRQLLDGAHEIKLKGKYLPVKAQIKYLPGLSAHGDQRELLNWASGIQNKPKRVYIVHGEAGSSHTLALKLRDEFGWNTIIPLLNEKFSI